MEGALRSHLLGKIEKIEKVEAWPRSVVGKNASLRCDKGVLGF
jgi:hypothetical protein